MYETIYRKVHFNLIDSGHPSCLSITFTVYHSIVCECHTFIFPNLALLCVLPLCLSVYDHQILPAAPLRGGNEAKEGIGEGESYS